MSITDREYDEAIASLPLAAQARLREERGVSLRAVMALNDEQKKINNSLAALTATIKDMHSSVLLMLGKHECRLDEHDRDIEDLNRRVRVLEDHAGVAS